MAATVALTDGPRRAKTGGFNGTVIEFELTKTTGTGTSTGVDSISYAGLGVDGLEPDWVEFDSRSALVNRVLVDTVTTSSSLVDCTMLTAATGAATARIRLFFAAASAPAGEDAPIAYTVPDNSIVDI